MSENGSIEENITGTSSENVKGEVSKIHTLTQKAVNDQFKGFIAPLTRQLEELIRLVLRMVITPHLSHYHRADFGTSSGTATYQSDTTTRASIDQTVKDPSNLFNIH